MLVEHPEAFQVVSPIVALEQTLRFVFGDHPVHHDVVAQGAFLTRTPGAVEGKRGRTGCRSSRGKAPQAGELGDRLG